MLLTLAALATVADIAVGTGAWFFMIAGVGTVAAVMVRPEIGIGVFLSTFLITYPASLQGAGFLTINNMLGLLFLFLLAQQLYYTNDWWFLRRWEIRILFIIALVYYLSSALNGPEPRLMDLIGALDERPDSVRLFLNRVAFSLFFVNFIRTPGQIRFIYLLATAIMIFTVVTGVWGVLSGANVLQPGKAVGGSGGFRAYSLIVSSLGNPNRLAMAAVLAYGVLWYMLSMTRSHLLQVVVIGLMLVMAMGVAMTASRSGLIVLVAVNAFIVVVDGIAIQRLLAVGLIGLIAVSLVLRFVPDKAINRLENLPVIGSSDATVGTGSLQRREYNWEIGFQVVKENVLLGVGPGNWEITRYLNDPARITTPPHSSLILTMAEGGIIALGGFLVLFWLTWLNFRVAQRLLPSGAGFSGLLWVVKGAQVGLIGLVLFSAVADLWQSVLLFWLVGLGVVLRRYAEEQYSVAI